LSLDEARQRRHEIDWQAYTPPRPAFTGVRVFDRIDLALLTDYIDWMPFFNAWEFHGKYPAILSDATVGEAATALHNDARAMLESIVREEWLQARAVLGMFAANSTDHDDLLVFADDERKTMIERLCHLRQQRAKPEGHAQNCLADFVAPADSGVDDFVGAFAVTSGASRNSRKRTTTTTRSCSRRLPIVSRRRWPNTCTSACASSTGRTRRTSISITMISSRSVTGAYARRRGTRHARTIPRKQSSGRYWTWRRTSISV
jgi:cobalamin-dependent methionine synthase I